MRLHNFKSLNYLIITFNRLKCTFINFFTVGYLCLVVLELWTTLFEFYLCLWKWIMIRYLPEGIQPLKGYRITKQCLHVCQSGCFNWISNCPYCHLQLGRLTSMTHPEWIQPCFLAIELSVWLQHQTALLLSSLFEANVVRCSRAVLHWDLILLQQKTMRVTCPFNICPAASFSFCFCPEKTQHQSWGSYVQVLFVSSTFQTD